MSKENYIVEPEELMAYLDGELPAKQAASTAAHLEHCHECRTLAAELKEVSELLQAWQADASEPELSEEVAAALKEDERAKDKPGSYRLPPHRRLLNLRYWPKRAWGLAVIGVILFALTTPMFFRKSVDLHTFSSPVQDLTLSSQGGARPSHVPAKKAEGFQNSQQPVGTPPPAPGVGTAGRLEKDQSAELEEETQDDETSNVPGSNGPMIIRTADLAVTTPQFDKARAALDDILKRHHGHIGELNVNTPPGSARSLTATLRVPSNRMDVALADLKGLGRVDKESQGGQEVTQEYIDLQARLANSRHTEQRLTDILRERTGKLSDVLSVEMQISRVRGEIERMEAQRKGMKNQVDFATVNLNVAEEYEAEIKAVPPSTSTRFRNAAIEGYRSVVDGIIAVLLWLLTAGPTLLLWAAILFFPARMVWRRARRYRRDRA